MHTIARMLPLVAALAATLAGQTYAQTQTIPPPARPVRALAGIEVMTATIFQEGNSSFSGLGLRLEVHPPQLIDQIAILPTIEYWRNSSKVQPWGIETTRKDATLGVDMRYDFRHSSWQPYIGGGVALHFFSNQVDAPSLGLVGKDSVIKGGLAALGGIQFGITDRLSNLIEVKYHHVPDQSQVKINWGLSYSL